MWLDDLKRAVDATNQTAVAEKLGCSPSVVSQVLSHTYKGGLKQIQRRVELALGDGAACPVLGPIDGPRCIVEQKQKLVATNPMRVRLWQCCKTCPNNLSVDEVQP